MKKYLLLFSLVIVSSNFFGQKLIEYQQGSCSSNSYPEYIKNRIVSQEFHGDTLILSVGFVSNCCLDANPRISLKSDSLIIEIVNVSEVYCACDCCFEIEFKVCEIKDTNFNVFLTQTWPGLRQDGFVGEHEYEKIDYCTNKFIFPTLDELNKVKDCGTFNEKGVKIGLWEKLKYNEQSGETLKIKTYYSLHNSDKEIVEWLVFYGENGSLNEVCVRSKQRKSISCLDGDEYYKLMKE